MLSVFGIRLNIWYINKLYTLISYFPMSTEKIITMIYQRLGNNLFTSFNTKLSNSFIIILGTTTQITEDSQLLSLLIITLLSTINKSATLLYYVVWWSYLAAALDYVCIWLTTPYLFMYTGHVGDAMLYLFLCHDLIWSIFNS